MKLARPMKSRLRSSKLCSSTAARGAARKNSSTRATHTSSAWPAQSTGSVRWRTAARTATSGIEEAQPLRQDAQPQARARLERLLGQEVERQVHRERLAEAVGGDVHQAVGAEELDLLDARVEHVRVAVGDRPRHDVLRAQVDLEGAGARAAVAFEQLRADAQPALLGGGGEHVHLADE